MVFLFFNDLGTVLTVWYFCFSIRFGNSSDSVVFVVFLLDLGTVLTVWYFCFSMIWELF